jgi:predicted transcriptional regulator of viral defense system
MIEQKAQITALAKQQGVIRPKDVSALGLNPLYLRQLVAEGQMVRSARGLYTLADFDITESHSLVEAVRLQSKGVVCLLSALSFHQIGTQLPHQVWLSVPFGTWISHRETAPVRTVVMRSPAYEAGIEWHRLEGIDVPVYNVAKTIADCFKFRATVGLDVCLEALREAIRERRGTRGEIHKFAKINRVDKLITPYMEAVTP